MQNGKKTKQKQTTCSLSKEFIVCDLINILFGFLSKMVNFLTESLNEPIDGDFLITSGREFHKTGPKQLIDSCFIFKWAGWLLYWWEKRVK